MLVVISDLHFQDTINDMIKDEHGNIIVDGIRNVPPETFEQTFQEILATANSNNAQELIIVLAGDIFDFNRSQQWFASADNIRPYGYHSAEEWGPIAEKIIRDILASNKQTFDIFKNYANASLDNGQKVSFNFIPGNHDRLVNLHQPLRKKISDLFGLVDDGAPFSHEIAAEKYGVHIRHGHEYDSTNFAGKVPPCGPFVVNAEDYNIAPLGDYVTIDIATRLAFEYRRRHEADIISGPDAGVHQFIYRTLLEFDDLRPQAAIFTFLSSQIHNNSKLKELLLPVLSEVLLRALDSSFFQERLGSFKVTLAKIAKFIPLELLLSLFAKYQSINTDLWFLPQREYVPREPLLQNPHYYYMVSGHTHNPDIIFLSRRQDGRETFFFDTGSWRQQLRKCYDNQTFAAAKALTYVTFYSPDENILCKHSNIPCSFDYRSGYTKGEIRTKLQPHNKFSI